jgi:hypothetical protein
MRSRIARTVLAVTAVLVLAGISTAQQAEDPRGWNKASWGMTKEEIKTAIPQAVDFDYDSCQGLRGKVDSKYLAGMECVSKFFGMPIEVNTLKCVVSFHLSAGVLASVNLLPQGENAIASVIGQHVFLDGLTDKYGAPTHSDVKPVISGLSNKPDGQEHTWEWVFSETIITLKFYENNDPHFSSTGLTYRKRQKADAL